MNKNKDERIVKHDQRSSSFPYKKWSDSKFEEGFFLVNYRRPTSEKWQNLWWEVQAPELMGVLLSSERWLGNGRGLDFDLQILALYDGGAHNWCNFINVGSHPPFH